MPPNDSTALALGVAATLAGLADLGASRATGGRNDESEGDGPETPPNSPEVQALVDAGNIRRAARAARSQGGRLNLRGADLRGLNIGDAYLIGANLQGANLQGANLRIADLLSANLQDTNLQNANLQATDLRNANLRGADLRSASLLGADLRNANLQGADLRGADFRGAHLPGANLKGAQADANTQISGTHWAIRVALGGRRVLVKLG
jgi:hypothetical protein